MAYKNIEHNFSFADFAIQSFADKNSTLLFLRQVGNIIDWQPIQELKTFARLPKFCFWEVSRLLNY